MICELCIERALQGNDLDIMYCILCCGQIARDVSRGGVRLCILHSCTLLP